MKNKCRLTLIMVLLVWVRLVAQEPTISQKKTVSSNAIVHGKKVVAAEERQFFKWYFKNEVQKTKTNKVIFYLDSLASTLSFEKEDFNRDTLMDMNNGLLSSAAKDALILTKVEKEYILREFDNMSGKKWGYKLAPNAVVLNNKDLTKFIKTYRWSIGIYSFTKPIFLRNNTLCIIYSSYVCGDLCGSGGFTIYCKRNGKWERWLNINRWLS